MKPRSLGGKLIVFRRIPDRPARWDTAYQIAAIDLSGQDTTRRRGPPLT